MNEQAFFILSSRSVTGGRGGAGEQEGGAGSQNGSAGCLGSWEDSCFPGWQWWWWRQGCAVGCVCVRVVMFSVCFKNNVRERVLET